MKIRFLYLILAGSAVISVMISGCKKDDNTPGSSTRDTGIFKDNRDGKTYKWAKIGEQVWMAENLNYTGSGNHITDNNEWHNNSNYNGWCYYYNMEYFSNSYGVLYQWNVAKIACPAGWHLPNDEEWAQLENYLIENGFSYDGVVGGKGIAKSLAAYVGWAISDKPGAVGNWDFPAFRNKTWFSALPGGYRNNYGNCDKEGNSGSWWSATADSSYAAYNRSISYSSTEVNHNIVSRAHGFSVRCVRD